MESLGKSQGPKPSAFPQIVPFCPVYRRVDDDAALLTPKDKTSRARQSIHSASKCQKANKKSLLYSQMDQLAGLLFDNQLRLGE